MKPDEEGFLYPEINSLLCIDCGLCLKVCPLKHEGSFKQNTIPRFYAARHKKVEVLKNSTSGGAFTAISDAILDLHGIIYGASFDENFHVLHMRAETHKERDKMRISKYVQSNLNNAYKNIKDNLLNKRKVLFTGTPCETAGLLGFLGSLSLSENLYTCDVICHSIPSPRVWEDYKDLLQKEWDGKLTSIQFRSKKYDWKRENSKKGFLFTIDNSTAVHEDSRFYHLFFYAGTIARPSCAKCRFTDIHRPSDLTIADYWGIEKYNKDLYNPLGVSLILVNSQKGETLFKHAEKYLTTEERPKEEELNEQQRLKIPMSFPIDRSEFWKDYNTFGFKYVLEKSMNNKR